MIETNKQKLDRIKSEARHDELATSTGTRPIVIITPDDYAWLVQEAKRVEQLEAELKGTITKKNRQHKETMKRLKKAEWSAMIHENGHAKVYAQLYELRESLKRGDNDA